jgi:hypothetical protein
MNKNVIYTSEGKHSAMFTERKHSGLQNGNMFNTKLIAVTHDSKALGKGGRKRGVNKPENFKTLCFNNATRRKQPLVLSVQSS